MMALPATHGLIQLESFNVRDVKSFCVRQFRLEEADKPMSGHDRHGADC
jgi:hypothetical protein